MYEIIDGTMGERAVVIIGNESEDLAATIAPGFGGACVGLRHGQIELLHGAGVMDQGAMKGRIPVLFPMVGRSFEKGEIGFYRHHGNVYPMDIHGFVKDMPWRETGRRCDASGASSTCEINADDATLTCYPYDFRLSIEYRVEGMCLSILATVRNLGDEPMPFCFGYHPYFRAPMGDGRREDCILRVPGRKIWEMCEGRPTGRQLDAPPEFAAGTCLSSGHLERIFAAIEKPAGGGGALCELESPDVNKAIRIEFDEQALETVTVFSPADSGFVCLEPRAGLPGALSDTAPVREGVKSLPPQSEFRTLVRILLVDL